MRKQARELVRREKAAKPGADGAAAELGTLGRGDGGDGTLGRGRGLCARGSVGVWVRWDGGRDVGSAREGEGV